MVGGIAVGIATGQTAGFGLVGFTSTLQTSLTGDPGTFMVLAGVAILIATPLSRALLAIPVFLRSRDPALAALAGFILLVVLFTTLLGLVV